jgi:hypothetical protein
MCEPLLNTTVLVLPFAKTIMPRPHGHYLVMTRDNKITKTNTTEGILSCEQCMRVCHPILDRSDDPIRNQRSHPKVATNAHPAQIYHRYASDTITFVILDTIE